MIELGFFIKLDFRILTKGTWAFLRCSFVCGATELLASRAASRSCPPSLPTGAGGSWKWPDGRDRSLCASSGHLLLSSPGMSPGKQCQGGEDRSCPCVLVPGSGTRHTGVVLAETRPGCCGWPCCYAADTQHGHRVLPKMKASDKITGGDN